MAVRKMRKMRTCPQYLRRLPDRQGARKPQRRKRLGKRRSRPSRRRPNHLRRRNPLTVLTLSPRRPRPQSPHLPQTKVTSGPRPTLHIQRATFPPLEASATSSRSGTPLWPYKLSLNLSRLNSKRLAMTILRFKRRWRRENSSVVVSSLKPCHHRNFG